MSGCKLPSCVASAKRLFTPWAWPRLLLSLCLLSAVVPASAEGCLLVFGHGRNFEPAEPLNNEFWDRSNALFNLRVEQALRAAGHEVFALRLSVAETDLRRNLSLLLERARQQDCSQILETTVFADLAEQTIKARLRLYPVLASRGPRVAEAASRIGEPVYSNQREMPLSLRSLARLDVGALAALMSEEFLQATKPQSVGPD